MEPVSGKQVATRLRGILNPKYQVHAYGVDLTVHQMYALDPTGRVDFGGGEYTPAGKVPLGTQPQRPDDAYEWWDVGRGSYLVEFNEALELADDEIALVEPNDRLLRAGAAHAPVLLRGRVEKIEVLLNVNLLRVQIKQNARVSHLRIFRFGDPRPAPASGRPKPVASRKRR
jgi:deoxycytidine triphosphate deaminase